MGNTCRGSFGGKNFKRLAEPAGSKQKASSRSDTVSSSSSDKRQEEEPKHSEKPRQEVYNGGGHFVATALEEGVMKRGMELPANSVLGHRTANVRDFYNLGPKLGQGQFGTTYLCTEIATGIEFACKSISKRKLITKEDMEDVRREIQIMHHLSGHKNVVKIKGAYEDTLYVHIIMEVCAGGELFDRIIQRGHYSERKAAELTKIIVGVVEACHSLGVMHRDLKPENFLLANKDDDLSLKAIDFGLSVFFKPGQVFTDVVGSPYYVAPEVLCKHYGPEADVWTAGVILYILLSGVPPFWAGGTLKHSHILHCCLSHL